MIFQGLLSSYALYKCSLSIERVNLGMPAWCEQRSHQGISKGPDPACLLDWQFPGKFLFMQATISMKNFLFLLSGAI